MTASTLTPFPEYNPSDPDYLERLYDTFCPNPLRHRYPRDRYVADSLPDSYYPKGYRPVDEDIREALEALASQPREIIDLTDDDDTPPPSSPQPSTSVPFLHIFNSIIQPEVPLPLAPLPKYTHQGGVEIDVDMDLHNAWKGNFGEAEGPLYNRIHLYTCLRRIMDEEEKLRDSMEKICQLEEMVRKYEYIRNTLKWEKLPENFYERMSELKGRKEEFMNLLKIM
jgi:hypothetical protein